MKKLILLTIAILFSFASMAQIINVKSYSIENSNTQIGAILPAGTTIFNIETKTNYRLLVTSSASNTLNTPGLAERVDSYTIGLTDDNTDSLAVHLDTLQIHRVNINANSDSLNSLIIPFHQETAEVNYGDLYLSGSYDSVNITFVANSYYGDYRNRIQINDTIILKSYTHPLAETAVPCEIWESEAGLGIEGRILNDIAYTTLNSYCIMIFKGGAGGNDTTVCSYYSYAPEEENYIQTEEPGVHIDHTTFDYYERVTNYDTLLVTSVIFNDTSTVLGVSGTPTSTEVDQAQLWTNNFEVINWYMYNADLTNKVGFGANSFDFTGSNPITESDVDSNVVYVTNIKIVNDSGEIANLTTGLCQFDGIGSYKGWRLNRYSQDNYGTIGGDAVDLSASSSTSTTRGATGVFSFAVGNTTTASGSGASVFGAASIASGAYSFAAGSTVTASGQSSFAFGSNTTASAGSAAAFNSHTTASNYQANAFGYYTTASGRCSFVSGDGNNASSQVIASGKSAWSHQTATAYNNYTAAADYCAILGGTNNNIDAAATNSIILGGTGITATTANTTYTQNINSAAIAINQTPDSDAWLSLYTDNDNKILINLESNDNATINGTVSYLNIHSGFEGDFADLYKITQTDGSIVHSWFLPNGNKSLVIDNYNLTYKNSDGNTAGYISPEEGIMWYDYENPTSPKIVLSCSENSYINAGNVGIGTSSPTSKLQVVGNATATTYGSVAPITNVELGYVDGATSNIQTQINSLATNTGTLTQLSALIASNSLIIGKTYYVTDNSWLLIAVSDSTLKPVSGTMHIFRYESLPTGIIPDILYVDTGIKKDYMDFPISIPTPTGYAYDTSTFILGSNPNNFYYDVSDEELNSVSGYCDYDLRAVLNFKKIETEVPLPTSKLVSTELQQSTPYGAIRIVVNIPIDEELAESAYATWQVKVNSVVSPIYDGGWSNSTTTDIQLENTISAGDIITVSKIITIYNVYGGTCESVIDYPVINE